MKEIKFPIEFSVCPACGGDRRIGESVINEEVEKGKLKPGAIVSLSALQSPIFEPPTSASLVVQTGAKIVPVVISYLDICADCGTLYCVKAVLQQAQINVQAQVKNQGLPKN